MYALVEIKGKQYRAEKGAVLKVDKLNKASGDIVEFDKVLLLSNGDDVKVGSPYVDGIKISTTVEENGRDKKVLIHKFKRRKNYRRKRGHRQSFTKVRVDDITGA